MERQDEDAMKIGITCYPTYGGSGAVATELGIHLARKGHEVHFVTYAHPFRLQEFQERIYFHAVEMEEYPLFEHPPYSLALAVTMHDVVRNHALDVFHVHYAIPHATSALLARQMLASNTPGADPGVRIVTTLHGTDITLVGQHPSFREITRFSIAGSDGLTAVSEYLARETESAFDIDAGDITVIPNFVDTELYRRDRDPCHRDVLADPDEKIVMHISNFRKVKRIPDVVAIFAGIRREMPARLVLIGDGPERALAERKARAAGLAEDTLFLGKQESVAELLACADLFLLPSESESFGLAALEAMACGVPVVATAVGGLPEVIPTGEAGYLEAVGAVDAMAARGVELLADDERWNRASEAARRTAVERFSAERVVPVYEDFYRAVLRGGRRDGSPGRADPGGDAAG